ncbi:hypothetical protein TYRP_016726, partial [Tyrophagus putrescentiae]
MTAMSTRRMTTTTTTMMMIKVVEKTGGRQKGLSSGFGGVKTKGQAKDFSSWDVFWLTLLADSQAVPPQPISLESTCIKT